MEIKQMNEPVKQQFFFFMFSWQTPIYLIALIGICMNSISIICIALFWTLFYPIAFDKLRKAQKNG